MKKTLLLTAAALITMAGAVSAQTIGVDFNNDSSAPNVDPTDPGTGISPTCPDKGVLGETFIGINKAGTAIALKDGVTMDLTSTGPAPAFRDQWSDGTSDLFRDYVQADPGQTLTITLHGLTPKTAYALVAYAASTRAGNDATTITGALTGTCVGQVAGTAVSRAAFVANENYIQGTATADDKGTLAFTISGMPDHWAVLNGFGITPASAAPKAP